MNRQTFYEIIFSDSSLLIRCAFGLTIITLTLVLWMQTESSLAQAQEIGLPLTVTLNDIGNGQPIPGKFAYCIPDGSGGAKDGGNVSPAITWSAGPTGTKSYVLLVVDKDVPASFELANQVGKIIPADFHRQNFYHWVLINIPVNITSFSEGESRYGIVGQNSFGARSKSRNGYDGPCPPWNDVLLHHYHFQIYALDISTLSLGNTFSGKQVDDAMNGHILAQGQTIGTYTTNPQMLVK